MMANSTIPWIPATRTPWAKGVCWTSKKEDQALRRQPSSSYATMNGPVIRELEKRKQREALMERLQTRANQQHHCRLQEPDFTS